MRLHAHTKNACAKVKQNVVCRTISVTDTEQNISMFLGEHINNNF